MSERLRILPGDCRETLRTLPTGSVQCVVTSPPYWRLRDYGVSGQIGLEASLAEYVQEMVAVFAEVGRVLREDGTVWLNLGDMSVRKNLLGIPWRVAFALQEVGWLLRTDIIWHKRNPLPESVSDRPTRVHEYIFLLTRSARYFYDGDAIREPVSGTAHPRGLGINPKSRIGAGRVRSRQNESFSGSVRGLVSSKNKRSVWSLTNAPFKGAHFATFPPELIRPCIRAGSSAHGCCAECGAPFVRVIEKGQPDLEHQRACGGDALGLYGGSSTKNYARARAQDASATKARILAGMKKRCTVGWTASCGCSAPSPVPCAVLDPFAGSGTTGMVSLQEGRHAILCELNGDYIKLIEQRCSPFLEGITLKSTI